MGTAVLCLPLPTPGTQDDLLLLPPRGPCCCPESRVGAEPAQARLEEEEAPSTAECLLFFSLSRVILECQVESGPLESLDPW